MRAIAAVIKRYWWGVFKTLVGAYLVAGSVYTLAGYVPSKGDYIGPLNASLFVGLGWLLLFYAAILIAGASLMHSGISRIIKNRKAAAERGS